MLAHSFKWRKTVNTNASRRGKAASTQAFRGGKTVIKGAIGELQIGEKTVSLHAFRSGKTVKGTTKQSEKAHLMRENREHTDIKLQEKVKIGAYWWENSEHTCV